MIEHALTVKAQQNEGAHHQNDQREQQIGLTALKFEQIFDFKASFRRNVRAKPNTRITAGKPFRACLAADRRRADCASHAILTSLKHRTTGG